MLAAAVVASTALVQGPALLHATSSAPASVQMFTGTKQSDPRINFKGPAKASLLKTGKAPTAVKSKKAFSSKKVGSTFVDVSGKAYQEVDTFVPQYDEVGVLPPLGRWDPLQIREQGPARYRRFVEMEIKHGRLAMAGFLGAITTYSGIRFPGYLSTSENILFSDLPGGPIASWAALPTPAWFQIIVFISFCEIAFLKQDPAKAPGDVVPEGVLWARYPDGYDIFLGDGSTKQVGEEELFLGKTWKLNAERNNGRAAMMGITGMIIHESLTGNPVFPIGETL
jgi:light-harvesting complex I chlorophyll a/b binding protein 1